MKQLILLTLIALQTSAFSQVPANYYNSATGLSGYALKTELKNIITNNYNSLSYSYLYTVYQTSDADNYYENDGTVLDMYSEIPSGTDAYTYAQVSSNNCTGSSLYIAEAECYNREHIVPQIAFNYQFPMKSDAHFVFPTDGFVNLQRGSLPFGEVSNPIYTSSNGSKKGNNSTPGYSSYVFEPIDEFKGDIARALFYFATRYEDSLTVWNHTMFDGSSNQVFEDWFLEILLDWHTQDPVTTRDITRNNVIYNNQNNANPFVNHPEYVDLIWNPIDTTSPTTPTNLIASNITSNSVLLNWNASTDDYIVDGYDIYRDGTLLSSTSTNSFTDFGLLNNTSYSYYVIAKDNTPNYSGNSNTVNITTSQVIPEYLIVDSFENSCFNSSFVAYSSASNKDWTCQTFFGYNNSGCISMNGYQENVLSDDWLISSDKLLFSNYNNTKLSCYLQYAFGTMSMNLIYSTNYTNGTDPALATWTAVPNVVIATGNGSGSTSVQNIINADISAITTDAHIAFRYISNGSPTRWNVDNFGITGIQNLADVISPTAPTNLLASNITTNSVDLNWSASTDNIAVTAYDLYRDGGLIATTASTNYTDNSLTASTSYTYYIVAKDAAGNVSGNSNSVNITTNAVADVTSPTTPSLSTSNVTNNSVDLNWTSSTDNIAVTAYDLYRDGVFIATTANTNYTDNILTSSTSYTYYVVAKDAAGNVSGNSNIVNITTLSLADVTSPTAPTNLVASNITKNSVDLNWNASTDNVGVTAYDIYRDAALVSTTVNTTYLDVGLAENTSYNYYVVAKDAAGNESNYSNEVDITTDKTDTANVNIRELFFKDLKVFPNPTKSGNIKIETGALISEIQLYSVVGELVKNLNDINANTLELKSLNKGTYILKIYSEGKSIQKNIIVL